MTRQKIKNTFNFHFGQPQDISDDIWNDYVESGRRKRFWQLYGIKTIAVTIFVTFGLNLILNESLDILLHNPSCHTPFLSLTTLIVGIICITAAVLLVFGIDRSEEYNRLKHAEVERKKQEEKEQEKKEIVDELKEFIKTECVEPKQ